MRTRIWIGVVAAGLLLAACGGGGSGSGDASGEPESRSADAPIEEPGAAAGSADESAVEVGAAPLPGLGPSVIKTAELTLAVERGEFKTALQRATTVASTEGGFVHSSSVEGEQGRRGTIVLRIPSDRFEAALASLRDLGTVERERVAGQDVSQEFVDLEARLRNLRAQEAVLLRLMGRAQTVADTIQVQKELTDIQLEMERIRGRLRFLEDQTSYGTISISMAEAGVAAPERPSIIAQAWERGVEGFLSVIGGLITAMGVLLPIAVLGIVGWVVVRRRLPTRA